MVVTSDERSWRQVGSVFSEILSERTVLRLDIKSRQRLAVDRTLQLQVPAYLRFLFISSPLNSVMPSRPGLCAGWAQKTLYVWMYIRGALYTSRRVSPSVCCKSGLSAAAAIQQQLGCCPETIRLTAVTNAGIRQTWHTPCYVTFSAGLMLLMMMMPLHSTNSRSCVVHCFSCRETARCYMLCTMLSVFWCPSVILRNVSFTIGRSMSFLIVTAERRWRSRPQ